MFEYLVNGEYVDDLPPTLQARKEFFTMKNASAVTPELVRAAGLTWENIVSHLGSTKEVWELCIPLMGEIALTRNLRNFEQAGISGSSWEQVYERLLAVEETVQLPFRFFSAEREVFSTEAKGLLARLLDRAVAKVADLPGVTLVLADNSGSACGCGISGKSKLRVADCGNMLEAVLAKRLGRRAIIGVFGDSLMWVPFSEEDTCLAIKHRIDAVAQREERSENGALAIPQFQTGAGVGGGTETGLGFGVDATQPCSCLTSTTRMMPPIVEREHEPLTGSDDVDGDAQQHPREGFDIASEAAEEVIMGPEVPAQLTAAEPTGNGLSPLGKKGADE